MKLLYIIDSLAQGGIATVLMHRLNFLAESGNFQIHILTEVENDKNIQQQFHKSIIFHLSNYKQLAAKNRIPFFGFFQFQREIAKDFSKVISKINPDVISTFNVEALNNFIVPHIQTSAIKIIEFHGAYESKSWLVKKNILPQESILKTIKLLISHPVNIFVPKSRRLHSKYDYGIVLTKEDEFDRKKYLKIKIKHIYNFMLTKKQINPYKDRKNIILGVGRMVQQKNLLDLVKAINLIKSQLAGWQVRLYGEGEQYNVINEFIIKNNLQGMISLEGYNYNMHEVYNESKVLVTPALWEGQPMNILEAFSYGIPVISYNCKCGPKEIIREGINGYLVDFDVNALADKILTLVKDPQLLSEFSQNTSIDINKFDYQLIMKQWEEFYREINKNRSK